MLHATLLAILVTLVSAATGSAGGAAAPATRPADVVPLYDGLGSYGRNVTTSSAEAQRYFDQGLKFLFAFNHDEAIRSFRRAAGIDPSCAMAWWGIAYANGPHINNPAVPVEREKAAWEALSRARRSLGGASDAESALVEALAARHSAIPPSDRKPLEQAYADAMRDVWKRFPEDLDVGAFFAEALMNLRPWDLWTVEGQPQPGTEEVTATLESILARRPDHALAAHLYIHAVEASMRPERADAAADALRDLLPGLGHLVHMPSHIDVRRGRWREAIVANTKAIEADRRYREQAPRQGFYRLYMNHNHHMLGYAAMMIGRSAQATAIMDEMVAGIPADWSTEFSQVADGFMAMPLEVRMRFGKWEEILAAPELPDRFPLARALRRYARGVAYAATGRPAEARAERKAFADARAALPAEAAFGNNASSDLLDVAAALLEGEILYFEGKVAEGIAALNEAVKHEDRLRYDEPPDWILPVRHALGAALLQAGRHKDAEAVYREDLKRLPANGWSLFGLARSLRMQDRNEEAARVEAEFEKAWAGADTPLKSSCFCQPGV